VKHTDPNQTKGAILGYTFDSLDELKESDQGRSFYAFWEFLISKNRQDQWKELIQQLFQVLEERDIRFDDVFLRKIKHYLYRAGQKVNDANDRMSEKLGRVISEKELAERLKVKEAVNRIKELALNFIDRDELPPIGIDIEENVPVNMPLEKKLNLEKSEAPVFDHQPEPASRELDAGQLLELYSPYVVDKKELRDRVKQLLKEKNQVSLKEVLDVFPLEKGLSELLAYFSLAERDYNHIFNTGIVELIVFDPGNRKYIEIPQIIFTR
jgi:putative ubiquitin-RnfH superfamily antitoxin RatB of RatAB toxin-antitoxin module